MSLENPPTPRASNPDEGSVSVARVQRIIQDFIKPQHGMELVPVPEALGRVLAADVLSPIHVPAHDNSAMDGYALRGQDLPASDTAVYRIVGTAYAGRPYPGPVEAMECVRIMTGAVMPARCDTVIPQESILDRDPDFVRIAAGTVQPGDNRRLQGEDLTKDQPAVRRGRILRPADLGLLASLGVAEVALRRCLKVAIFSTGDELRSLGETLEPGCIYDSNRYTIRGMLDRLGCEIIDLGVVRDDPISLEAALRGACAQADAIITSGGVSVGEADYTKQVMDSLGEVNFWKIGMRPGRPMAFGTINSNGKRAYLFGLPGNPVAVMVTFYFFVRDALLHLMGARGEALPRLRALAQADIRKKPGRTEYQRGILGIDVQGQTVVRITGSQGSGVLRSMAEANCMVVLPESQGNVRAGEAVEVVVFDGLV